MPLPTALCTFKEKIENAVSMVATMSAEQKLDAVQYWNVMSEKLQEIVNHSAADITALSFALEKEKQAQMTSEYIEDGTGQTYHLLTSTSGSGSTMALITKYKECSTQSTHGEIGSSKQGKSEVEKIMMTEKTLPTSEGHESGYDKHLLNPDDPEYIDISEIRNESNDNSPGKIKDLNGSEASEIVECEYCVKTFTSSSQLSVHKWIHIKPYICDECGARFASKGNLIVHTRSHTGERPYTCSLCAASFSTRGNLKRHDKAHTGAKPWECPECHQRFTENKSLKVHMRRHTGERPYKCSVCPKAFAQRGILQSHMALHLDQKAHLCDTCGKAFRQKSQLRLHTLRHSNIKRYSCNCCPAQFLTKGDMQRHERTHTGERPFSCGLCKKTFTRQQTLTEHMNRHYGLRPYLCKYCRKAFAEMSACYKHIKSHERDTMLLERKPEEGGMSETEAADSVIIDASLINMNEHGNAGVIIEQEVNSFSETLEVARNELVISTPRLLEQRSRTVSVLQKVDSTDDPNMTTITVLQPSEHFV